MLVDQRRLEPLFHQLLAGPRHRSDAGIQRVGDLTVAPAFTHLRIVSLQQDAGLGELPGRALA
jgi:hypothetical protein